MKICLIILMIFGAITTAESVNFPRIESERRQCQLLAQNLITNKNFTKGYLWKEFVKFDTNEDKKQLSKVASLFQVSKFHRNSFYVGLIPKFSEHIPVLTGILVHSAISEKQLELLAVLLYIGADVDVCNRNGSTPLYKAIDNGQTEIVNVLVKCGANPNHSFNNVTLLHKATSEGKLDLLKTLIKLGARVNVGDADGKTPLFYAIKFNRTEVVSSLLAEGANVNFKSPLGRTLLHNGVMENSLHIVKQLIELGCKVDAADKDGVTPLYVAFTYNNLEIINLLIESGANVNFVTQNGNSLLHIATLKSNRIVAEGLLNFGANQLIPDHERLTPLYRAIKNDDMDMVECFSGKSYILNTEVNGVYPLHFAVEHGTVRAVKILLERGAHKYSVNNEDLFPFSLAILNNKTEMWDLLTSNEKNMSSSMWFKLVLNRPLKMAVKRGDLAAVKRLLDSGASVNKRSEDGKTALGLAVETNNGAIIKLLVDRGADPTNMVNRQGDTLLHLAVANHALDAVKVLVELGLDVNAINNRGLSPVFLATLGNNSTIIRYLVSKGANIDARLRNGDTPIQLAISNGTLTTFATLMELGADINNNRSRSAIEKAVECDRPEIIKLLVAKGVPLAGKTSLLHLAAQSGSVEAIQTLINMGIPVDEKSDKYSPLWLATKHNRIKAMKVLLKNGANIDETTDPPFSTPKDAAGSWTLLHETAFRNLVDATALLLDHGMDPNPKDFRSWTPLHYAAIMNKLEVAQLLLERGANVQARTKNGLTPIAIIDYNQESAKQKMVDLLKLYIEGKGRKTETIVIPK